MTIAIIAYVVFITEKMGGARVILEAMGFGKLWAQSTETAEAQKPEHEERANSGADLTVGEFAGSSSMQLTAATETTFTSGTLAAHGHRDFLGRRGGASELDGACACCVWCMIESVCICVFVCTWPLQVKTSKLTVFERV